jgi:uncharacterized membrane protein YccC
MSKDTEQAKYKGRPLSDPEPLSLAIAIVRAIATVGALAIDIRGQVQKSRSREEERRRHLRNAVFRAQRLLNACRASLEDLANFLYQYGHTDSDFRLGAAPLVGDLDTVNEIRELYSRIHSNAEALQDAFVQISELLESQDFEIVSHYVMELDALLFQSLQSIRYHEFIRTTSSLIDTIGRLLADLSGEDRTHSTPRDDFRAR